MVAQMSYQFATCATPGCEETVIVVGAQCDACLAEEMLIYPLWDDPTVPPPTASTRLTGRDYAVAVLLTLVVFILAVEVLWAASRGAPN